MEFCFEVVTEPYSLVFAYHNDGRRVQNFVNPRKSQRSFGSFVVFVHFLDQFQVFLSVYILHYLEMGNSRHFPRVFIRIITLQVDSANMLVDISLEKDHIV